jgi:hypothetical protein
MKTVVLTFLIALSTAAWADDKQDQKNVYDVFREWMKPSSGATEDEQVTARIKRSMANLLYPVDMSSFARPDQERRGAAGGRNGSNGRTWLSAQQHSDCLCQS